MFLNQHDFVRYIRASAKRGNLTVQWTDDPCPTTDGTTIRLPRLGETADELAYRKLVHYAVHESDHVLYSSFTLPKEKGVSVGTSFLGAIWNAVEDYRIERLGTLEYEGDRQNADYVYESMWQSPKRAIASRLSPTAKPEDKDLAEKIGPLFSFLNDMNKDMYPSAHRVDGDIAALMTPTMQEKVKKLRAGNYADVLRNAATITDPELGTAATYEVAKRIYEEVYGEDAKKEEERCKAQAQAQEEGEGKEGDGKGKKKAKGKGKPGEEGEEEGEGSDADVDYMEWMPNAHGKEAHGDPVGHHVNYDEWGEGSTAAVPATDDEFRVVDFGKKQTNVDGTSFDEPEESYIRLAHNATTKTSEGFASKVRMKLQIRSRSRYEYGVKRGRIHAPALYRAVLKDSPGVNERVFKRRIVNDTLDTCVSVLVDTSGSMSGSKYAHAMVSAMLLNESIGNVLGIPLEIAGFSEVRGRRGESYSQASPLMYLHRSYNTPRLSEDELLRRMSCAASHMTGNPDGDAIVWMYDRIKTRPEKRKLLVVLSDGSPACGRYGDQMKYAKTVVKQIEKEKRVQIVGIGIMDTNVRHIYKESYVIHSADTLETALLSLVDKKIA